MTPEQREDLRTILKHVLFSPELLVSAAAQRGLTIRAAYESVIEELRLLDTQEGVKA